MTAYDRFAYSNNAYSYTHARRMAARALLMGLRPASPERCRILEVGCGAGGNLVPMAYDLPRAELVGIDLAAQPVAEARAFARITGVTNVRFEQADIREPPSGLGMFDYIIAHGVYSWVPEPVREALMRLFAECLTENGVAYVSYNVLPGCYYRLLLRDLLLAALPRDADLAEVVKGCRRFLEDYRLALPHRDAQDEAVHAEITRVLERPDAQIIHDDLSPDFHALYFRDLEGHAARHGLQFLCESGVGSDSATGLQPAARQLVDRLSSGDAMLQEQWNDMVRLRRFRMSLLVRREQPVRRGGARIPEGSLWVMSHARESAPDSSAPAGARCFSISDRDRIQTNNPAIISLFERLISSFPEAVPVDELKRDSVLPLEHVDEFLLQLHSHRFADFSPIPWRAVRDAGPRPEASRVARAMAGQGAMKVTNLFHGPVELGNEAARRLLELLDGERDYAALARIMQPLFPGKTREQIEGEIPGELRVLARLGMLIR
ncbi:MAG: class I SAM-dependent methyltransferase [Bryobacteraceae bacterium]|nr:class I SAM-dependent methyltransferase [Bryobacteraceae bacterium]